MRNFLGRVAPVGVLFVCLCSAAFGFEYKVEMPSVLREGGVGHGVVRLMVKPDEEAVIVGVAPPKENDALVFTPGSLTLQRKEGDINRWTFTFTVKAKKRGKITPDPFIVSTFKEMPEDPETKPATTKLNVPPITIKPPLFFKRSGFRRFVQDLAIVIIVVGGVAILIRRRRKKNHGRSD